VDRISRIGVTIEKRRVLDAILQILLRQRSLPLFRSDQRPLNPKYRMFPEARYYHFKETGVWHYRECVSLGKIF
jgi:hypothetical protein